MLDSGVGQKEARLARIMLRAVVSLALGWILTFAIPMFMEAIWDYLKDSEHQPYPFVILLSNLLNLPAVIICKFFTPEVAHKSDLGLVCWAHGFFWNILYYGLMIFIFSWLIGRMIRRRKPRLL